MATQGNLGVRREGLTPGRAGAAACAMKARAIAARKRAGAVASGGAGGAGSRLCNWLNGQWLLGVAHWYTQGALNCTSRALTASYSAKGQVYVHTSSLELAQKGDVASMVC